MREAFNGASAAPKKLRAVSNTRDDSILKNWYKQMRIVLKYLGHTDVMERSQTTVKRRDWIESSLKIKEQSC